ncbi:MAG: hypothetical protein KJO44_02665 [Gemmatimonadetes bacterium]|nr:hypothetical protein [Gemmatimonadota bacterium]
MTALPEPPPESFDLLSTELIARFDEWEREPCAWEDDLLDTWARRAFRLQFQDNRPYRNFCEARDFGPATVAGWRDLPPVPTGAFRAVDLFVGNREHANLTFLTSGTTRGRSAQGRHLIRSPDLYRASLRAAFRFFVLQGEDRLRIVTLLPGFTAERGSSLGWMSDELRTGVGAGDGVSVATPTGIDWGMLEEVVGRSADAGRPLCLLGTTVGFAEWLDRLQDGRSVSPGLPAGSKLMDTGGAKGRAGLRRSSVVGGLVEHLGIRADAIVNEFGMTELLSQRYGRGEPPFPLIGPPWLRSRVLDPVTLEELPDGATGILCHFDLANLGSVCAVLTEDRGRIVGEGIEWVGRTEGAPPRGCSLATAELLEAQDHA